MPCVTATTFSRKLKRRQLLRSELEKQMSLLTGTLDYSGFHRVDMVVEAVFEDINLKHQMVLGRGARVRRAHRVCLQHLLPAHPPDRLGGDASGAGGGAALLQPGGQDAARRIIPHAGTSAETAGTTLASPGPGARPPSW